MNITNTQKNSDTNIIMLVYGLGGVGKTSFAATFPKPLILDFENGAKFLGDRGFQVDVARFEDWLTDADKVELAREIKNYETIVVDPLSEAMDKLITGDTISDYKYRQKNGDLTIAGWGKVKEIMRSFIRWLRESGKNILIITHVSEKTDEDKIIKRPMVATKLQEEIANLVDLVGYMYKGKEGDRKIYIGASDDRIICKDRTGKLPQNIDADFSELAKYLEIKNQPEHHSYQDDEEGIGRLTGGDGFNDEGVDASEKNFKYL